MKPLLRIPVWAWIALLTGLGPLASAQLSLTDIARETSDPSGNLWFLSTEFATSFDSGESSRHSQQTTIELQPTMPVPLTRDWRLLNFPDLVFASAGTPGGGQATGIRSFDWLAALSPASGSLGVSWGLGPYLSFPVSTSTGLASRQWQTGVGGVLAWRTSRSVISALVHSGWTTSGSGPIAQSLEIESNAQYFFGTGMQVGLGHPRIEYSRNRDGSGHWDVPVGVDVGRTFHLGKMPVKIMIEYDFYVLNDSRWEPEHLFRLTFLPVIASPFKVPLLD